MADCRRVLCVDDEPQVLEGLKSHLSRQYEVQTAVSGQAALDLLKKEAPFAVVLSDLRMPGMDGVTLLNQVRQRAPDTVCMLLTGHADLESAIAAINDGQLFRFLTKPCPPAVLLPALAAGINQYRLITAERVLLEQTLRGVIQALTDVLSLVHPLAFGRANRIKRHAMDLAREVGLQQNLWSLEVAAMLSQIGCIILPNETLEKLYRGGLLNEKERVMAGRLPTVTEQLLSGIPRLEAVRTILKNQDQPYQFSPFECNVIRAGGHILKIVSDFDTLINQDHPVQLALDTLLGRRGRYDSTLLAAFVAIRSRGDQQRKIKEISILALREGMVLAEDIRVKSGAVLITREHEVTPSFLERIYDFQESLLSSTVKIVIASGSQGD